MTRRCRSLGDGKRTASSDSPNAGAHAGVGEKVLVAWNARREAARAVFDALPILQRAKEVKVVWVNPQSEHDVAQDIPAADICAALARHGVKCQATEQIKPHASVGETLLACAKDMRADLLVMGAMATRGCGSSFLVVRADTYWPICRSRADVALALTISVHSPKRASEDELIANRPCTCRAPSSLLEPPQYAIRAASLGT